MLEQYELEIIREEEEAFQKVLMSIRRASEPKEPANDKVLSRMRTLRDEAAIASESDLPALFDQLHTHRALAERKWRDVLPDSQSPYFAHMRLRENGGVRDIFLGYHTLINHKSGVTLIDWRNAPISRIFYNYREGDEYLEEFPGRISSGVLEARRVLTIHEGELLGVMTPTHSYSKVNGGQWTAQTTSQAPRLAGGQGTATRAGSIGTGQAGLPAPEVSALLDPKQFALLETDPKTPLLVLGGAGSGKTTVAMHRMAALAYRDPHKFHPNSMMVIVPQQGLVRLSLKLLESLHMKGVRVTTFERWIKQEAKVLLRSLPKRPCDFTPFRISRFKRHPAVLAVFPEYLDRLAREMAQRMDRKLPRQVSPAESFFDDRQGCLMDRLRRAEQRSMETVRENPKLSNTERERIREFFDQEKSLLYDVAADRLELFGDKKLLELAVERSGGDLRESLVEEVLTHSIRQFSETSEERYAGVDSERLRTVDGRSIDEGTPDNLAGTIDVEDYAVLFELLRAKVGRIQTRYGRMRIFTHLVLDEAQELAPAELSVLGQSLRHSSAVTIAGDAAQQIDPGSSFNTWKNTLEQLGVSHAATTELKTSYRSARPIAEFAHKLLGPIAPPQPPVSVRDGAPVGRSIFPSEGHSAVFLTEALLDLLEREPKASVAIICRSMKTTRRLGSALARLPGVRIVSGGEFDFKPGADITDVAQVKGLEFDYVIIPDADGASYPVSNESRRAMHVAATRAIHQLWIIATGSPTAILPKPD